MIRRFKKRHSGKPRVREFMIRPFFKVVGRVPADFLGFTLDTSVLIGGRWWGESRGTRKGLSQDRTEALDLESPELIRYAQALGAGLLRVGGTEADRIRYGFGKELRYLEAPALVPADEERQVLDDEPYVFRKSLWKRLCTFARLAGMELVFTIGIGPECRDRQGNWIPDDARRLLSWSGRKDSPVRAWEFGNEVNAFPLIYGLRHRVGPARYARELEVFSRLVGRYCPGTQVIGPASAVWPLIGEVNPLIKGVCSQPGAACLDAVSFHYYPQQSRRGKVAVRRARPGRLLGPGALDEAGLQTRRIKAAVPPGKELWLTETGHALYGGQAGLSDTWESCPWWLDQLCLMASLGVDRVFRQSLVGGDYGLLDPRTFQPRPDYYLSFLWKKLIGTRVYAAPATHGPDRKLRVWHMAGKDAPSSPVIDPAGTSGEAGRALIPPGRMVPPTWLICINLDARSACRLHLEEHGIWGRASLGRRLILEGNEGPQSRSAALNGVVLGPDLVMDWGNADVMGRYGLGQPLAAGTGPSHAGLVLELPPLACALAEIVLKDYPGQ